MFTTSNKTSSLLLPILHSNFVVKSKNLKEANSIVPSGNDSTSSNHSIITKFLTSFFLLVSSASYPNPSKFSINSGNNREKNGVKQNKGNKGILLSQIKVNSTSSKIIVSFYYYHSNTQVKSQTINTSLTSASTLTNSKMSEEGFLIKELSRCSAILSTILEKEVEIRATRLFYPYMNSTILAHYLVKNSASNTFLHFQESILSYPSFHASSLPSSILGMKIQLAGRIITEAVVPRLTVKSSIVGSFRNGFVEKGFCTTKNKLGAFTIKVWIATLSLYIKSLLFFLILILIQFFNYNSILCNFSILILYIDKKKKE